MFELDDIVLDGDIISMDCHIVDSSLIRPDFFLKYNFKTDEILSDTTDVYDGYLREIIKCIKFHILPKKEIPKDYVYAWY
ncbi:hypothetical protein SAMN04487865_103415 [Succinivibrio dextrinosolvens]|uniref:Uncharacterized protein n=1 Tax=Succinivibrio dextrinosolvens TaxID=83771 RepID=A0A662ZA28_9GAMM|nr:hypothetical protein [Succinivibrio dextrinosolvens]SFK18440.1 hypothetical protein SAMN04487865_103415 [Succinivibrio dextrinosolvens]